VFDGGHSWPGATPAPEWTEPTTQEFDAAEEICRFAKPLLIPAVARRM
jgi:polyhydroxybutyrate depolymerase